MSGWAISPKVYATLVLSGLGLFLVAVVTWGTESGGAKAFGMALLFGSQLLMSLGTYSLAKGTENSSQRQCRPS